jgi:hypothetical protein
MTIGRALLYTGLIFGLLSVAHSWLSWWNRHDVKNPLWIKGSVIIFFLWGFVVIPLRLLNWTVRLVTLDRSLLPEVRLLWKSILPENRQR